MSEDFICTTILLMTPIILIVYISYSIRKTNEGKFVYRGTINKARSEFFREVFDLSESDFRTLHFDGKLFDLQEGSKHFSEFSSIRCMDSRSITVVNSDLPHSITWRHTRVSGGPDRRYSSNPETMHSTKSTFRFEGQTPCRLISYSVYCNIAELLRKFNRFLKLSKAYNIEEIIQEYESVADNLKALEYTYSSSSKRLAEVESALAAASRLTYPIGDSEDVITTQNKLRQEQIRLSRELQQMRARIFAVKSELPKITQRAKDLDALERYRISQIARPP